MHIDRANGNTA
jgi:Reverse transcriptase (RNA-dependent DNA polymerase)